MKKSDYSEFEAFCRQATDAQIVNIYRKEMDARRRDYAAIAKEEAVRRGVL